MMNRMDGRLNYPLRNRKMLNFELSVEIPAESICCPPHHKTGHILHNTCDISAVFTCQR